MLRRRQTVGRTHIVSCVCATFSGHVMFACEGGEAGVALPYLAAAAATAAPSSSSLSVFSLCLPLLKNVLNG